MKNLTRNPVRFPVVVYLLVSLFLTSVIPAVAQSASSATGPALTVPRVISVSGVFTPVDGHAPYAVEVVTLSIYAEPEGGLPVWQERQSVAVDNSGRFTVMAGATHVEGIPVSLFVTGQAQWMSLLFERAGEVEQPRVRITSVPYALKASDAETLGGLPASAYALASATPGGGEPRSADTMMVTAASSADLVLPGTTNFLAKYVNGGTDVGNSAVFEAGGAVGIGTTAPFDALHIQFNNPFGSATGFAVQNLGNTNTSYSGMLFYDQFGALAQFQGFNNVTHEYRINNIATSGSINFMLGGSSRFFVASDGNIGIGTTAPSAGLDVSNAVSGAGTANASTSTFANNNLGSTFVGRKARGSASLPSAVQNGDALASFAGMGYGANAFGVDAGFMTVRASENWTNTEQGTRLQFGTTRNGTATPLVRMTLDNDGRLGLGTTAAIQGNLEVVGTGNDFDVIASSFQDEDWGALFLARHGRGTPASPGALVSGDFLGEFLTQGATPTGWGSVAGMVGFAGEDWTDTTQGSGLIFVATPLGAHQAEANMVLYPGGNVGIGAWPFGTSAPPAITDRLQVFGDVRVGTTGTNGCLKNFDGTGIIGTCASDRRFKKGITPFSPVLNQVTALQPVHYFWRAEDFPGKHFGNRRAYGLIAQDVEQVLPDLVITDEEGFKAVDYSKLPLLAIQGLKELKAENDALKARNGVLEAQTEELITRITELERRFSELLTR